MVQRGLGFADGSFEVGFLGVELQPLLQYGGFFLRVRDQGGTLINVFAITTEEEPITGKTEVVLVDYDMEKKRYTAIPIDRK